LYEHGRIGRWGRRLWLLRSRWECHFVWLPDLAERRGATETEPNQRGSENEENSYRVLSAQPEMTNTHQLRHKLCSCTSNRIRSLLLKRTAAAIRAVVAAARASKRQPSEAALQRLQADSAFALGAANSCPEPRAPGARQDKVPALCDMPLCSDLNFARATMEVVALT
jgi:hypothetical protein